MREILFRGKRVDNEEWVEGSYCHLPSPNILFVNFKNEIDAVDIIPETVGQFTGLCDENGKKIFEGDILEDHNRIFNIEYSKHYPGFKMVCNDKQHYPISEIIASHRYKVIGNIHDNPELLTNN